MNRRVAILLLGAFLAGHLAPSSAYCAPKKGRSLTKMFEACEWAMDQIEDTYMHMRGRTPEEIAEVQKAREDHREKRAKAMKDWWEEVKRTRGARLLLKDIKEPEPSRLLSGLFHEHKVPEQKRWYHHFKWINPMHYFQQPFRWTTKWLTGKPHDLDIFSFMYHTLVRRPTAAATDRWLGRRQEPTLLFKLPLAFGTAYLVMHGIDQWWDRKIEEKMKESIDEHKEEFDEMLEKDFRFAVLKEMQEQIETEEGRKLTQQEMREAVYKLQQAHIAYAKYMAEDAKKDDPKTRREKRLSAMGFIAPHITVLAEEGVKPRPGFLTPPDKVGKLSDEQLDDILDIQDELTTRYHVIWTHLKGKKEDREKMMESENLKKRLNGILQDPYIKALCDLHDKKEISDDDLLFEIQRDSEWKARLATCEVMGVTPLRREGDQITDEPLTILTVRVEALNELADRAKARGGKPAR